MCDRVDCAAWMKLKDGVIFYGIPGSLESMPGSDLHKEMNLVQKKHEWRKGT